MRNPSHIFASTLEKMRQRFNSNETFSKNFHPLNSTFLKKFEFVKLNVASQYANLSIKTHSPQENPNKY